LTVAIRFLAAASVVLLIALAAFALIGFYIRRHGLFFPEPYPNGVWETTRFDIVPVNHWFQAADGVRLHGWSFEASDDDAPLMIWFHGNAGNITHRAPIAHALATKGISVFLFDYRGFGMSHGHPSEKSVFLDATAAREYAGRYLAKPSTPLVYYGESIGGPYAARVSRDRPPACLIIENSFPSLQAMARAHFGPLGVLTPEGLSTTKWLNAAGSPVLVLHGRRDQVVPFHLGMQLYDGLETTKTRFISDDAGHCEIPWLDPDRYLDVVTGFIRTHTRGTSNRTGPE